MIILKNKGEIDINVITTMGVHIKTTNNPIGFFGTGLKYAIAVFLRENIDIRLFIGRNEYYFYTQPKVIRDETFDICMMRGPYDSVELGFTTGLGKNWKPWQAYREIESNCRDEGGEIYDSNTVSGEEGYTTFAIDYVDEVRSIFLDNLNLEKLFSSTSIEIYKGQSNYIYYKGIRAKTLSNPSIYTYNILNSCNLTEDRLLCYDHQIEHIINEAVAEMDNKDIIRDVVTAKKETYESSLRMSSFNNYSTPLDTFKQVVSEAGNKCNSSAQEFIAQHTKKEELTPELAAIKFKQELDDFCSTHDIEYEIDRDGYVTLIACEILKHLNEAP